MFFGIIAASATSFVAGYHAAKYLARKKEIALLDSHWDDVQDMFPTEGKTGRRSTRANPYGSKMTQQKRIAPPAA